MVGGGWYGCWKVGIGGACVGGRGEMCWVASERSESVHDVLLMDLVRAEMLFWFDCWTWGGMVVSIVDGI